MSPRRTLATGLVIAACALLVGGGCDDFNSRRKINEGNKEFKDGKFEQAVATYESALADRDLDVGHYNLGVAYVKLFMPGVQNPRNAEYADKAAMHLARWLANHPRDNDIRKLMTSVWVDSGDFEKAIAYWEHEHSQAPTNRDIVGQLSSINLKAASNPSWEIGRPYWDATIRWILVDVDISPNPEGRVSSYIGVGRVVWATLSQKHKVVGAERIRVADTAISAMQKGLVIDPKNTEILGLMGAIYNFRALGHGASWAAAIDRASAQDHNQKQRVLLEEKKKAAAANTPPAPPPAEKSGG